MTWLKRVKRYLGIGDSVERKRKKHLLKALADILENRRSPNDFGICGLLADKGFNSDEYKRFFETWPDRSGHRHYPVPNPYPMSHWTREESAQWAFYHLARWVGHYGALRRGLVHHMISELEKELNDEPL